MSYVPFTIKMTTEEIVSKLKASFGTEFTATDIKAFCAMNDIAYATVTKRLKNFKTVHMNCSYSVGGQYLSYSWTYDGKKLYWEGIPINIGNNNIEQGMSINVRKLSSRDKFNIKINLTLWLYEFENDFYNKTSVVDFYGIKGFGSCY